MAKICKVEAIRFDSSKQQSKGFVGAKSADKKGGLVRTSTASPMLVHQDVKTGPCGPGEVAVKVTCDDGVYGYGATGGYRIVTASLIEEALAPLIIGLEATDVEKVWDIMFRSTIPVGRTGAMIEAISGIDVALWDILGKETGLPVYQLLGGKVRDKIKVYPTGFEVDKYVECGYTDIKIPMPYSFMHGEEGMKKNEELVAHAREVLGKEGFIALECYMGWNEEYTIKMAERLKQYDVRWIEEPVMPDQYDSYARLRDRLHDFNIMISGGEHEFTRYGAKKLLDGGCVDILQMDIGRAGGITEMRRVMAHASAHDIICIPHDHGAYRSANYHMTMNSVISPMAENLVVRGLDSPRMFTGEPMMEKDGFVRVEDKPGFGYDLNPEYIPL